LVLSRSNAHSVISLVFIQKRILCKAYYAYAELSLHLLAKMGILLVVDLERTNVEFVFRALEYTPIYHVDDSPSPKELSSTKHI